MPADLTSYLASRYLVADTKPTKKRKRKHNKDGGDGLLITDDDDSGWTTKGGRDDDDDDTNVVGAGGGYGAGGTIAGTSAEFRKTKKSNWTVLGGAGGSGSETGTGTPGAAATDADAIIAAAAADTAAALAAEDEAPVVEAEAGAATTTKKSAALMSDGTHAGLQSAASVTAQLERRRREEREQYERERQEKRERRRKRGENDEESGEEEVVYRDATGRRVDVALRRQEVRQAALEAEQKERRAKDALRGDVQREQARQRREELADAALMPLARGADDEAMNRELKAQARWNDPMAAFLTEKTPAATASGGASGSAPKAGAKSSRPVYRGPATPNRYGIRPGYRWDGVDRGIGFEAERFKAINRRERNRDLDYQWQTDV